LLTSSASRGDNERFQAAGFTAWLSKPARPERVVGAVLTAMAMSGRAQNDPRLDREARKPELQGKIERSNVRILIADDNQVNQRVAQKMLDRLGYRSDLVANGREAIEALQRVPYELILMDCQMPELDGFEATREIRRGDTPRRDVRIVALTANAMTGDRDRCLAAGMDDYLPKPFKIHTLDEVVQRNLRPLAGEQPDSALPRSA
jgi:CheY-like chemotaxis protein